MSPSVVYADAVLFDMDGTLTDSIGTQASYLLMMGNYLTYSCSRR